MEFFISWFIVGLISVFFCCAIDMRNKEFDENYFDKDGIYMAFVVLLLGYISPILILLVTFEDSINNFKKNFKKNLAKFIYEIVNIKFK